MVSNYKHGRWLVLCDRCGFQYHSHQLSKEWNGLRTCRGAGTNQCFEERHPQDLVRGRADRQKPAWTRPEGTDVFLSPGDVTPDDL